MRMVDNTGIWWSSVYDCRFLPQENTWCMISYVAIFAWRFPDAESWVKYPCHHLIHVMVSCMYEFLLLFCGTPITRGMTYLLYELHNIYSNPLFLCYILKWGKLQRFTFTRYHTRSSLCIICIFQYNFNMIYWFKMANWVISCFSIVNMEWDRVSVPQSTA